MTWEQASLLIGIAGLAFGAWSVTRPAIPKWHWLVLVAFATTGVINAIFY